MNTELALIAWWATAGLSGVAQQDAAGGAVWAEAPDPYAVGRFQPTFAAFIRVPGSVTLACQVRRPGPPEGCIPVSIRPEGMGYEVAALQTASTGWMAPEVEGGTPKPGSVRFTVRFSPGVWPDDGQAIPTPEPTPRALDLARSIVRRNSEAAPSDWEPYDYPDLAPERRVIVRDWMREIVPVDREKELDLASRFIAERVSEDVLDAYWTRNDPEGLRAAMATITQYRWPAPAVDGWTEAKIQELRARYCAAYDCGELSLTERAERRAGPP